MAIEEQVEQPTRPIAWGQLAAGSVIGGIAVWSIALHLSDTTPSAMLAGVAETYRAWRDWLLAPLLERAEIKLSPLDRDLLAFNLVMIGALVRTALRYPASWAVLAFVVLVSAAPIVWYPADLTLETFVHRWIFRITVFSVSIVILGPIAGAFANFMEPVRQLHHLTAPPARYALWNVVVIVAIAGGLLAADRLMP